MTSLLHFDGETFDPQLDGLRLTGQWRVVFLVMRDGAWRTLDEIQEIITLGGGQYYPLQSISARLRDFRKARFGGHTVPRRRRGKPSAGLFEYRLIVRRRRVIPRWACEDA
jgi:hypothetical protein